MRVRACVSVRASVRARVCVRVCVCVCVRAGFARARVWMRPAHTCARFRTRTCAHTGAIARARAVNPHFLTKAATTTTLTLETTIIFYFRCGENDNYDYDDTRAHTRTHTRAHTHTHTCTHTRAHARTHAHTCAHTCTRTRARVRVRVHTHTHTHVRARTPHRRGMHKEGCTGGLHTGVAQGLGINSGEGCTRVAQNKIDRINFLYNIVGASVG